VVEAVVCWWCESVWWMKVRESVWVVEGGFMNGRERSEGSHERREAKGGATRWLSESA